MARPDGLGSMSKNVMDRGEGSRSSDVVDGPADVKFKAEDDGWTKLRVEEEGRSIGRTDDPGVRKELKDGRP